MTADTGCEVCGHPDHNDRRLRTTVRWLWRVFLSMVAEADNLSRERKERHRG